MRVIRDFLLLLAAALALCPAQAAKPARYADPCADMSKELQKAKGASSRLILTHAAIGGAVGLGVGLLTGKGAAGAVKGVLAGAAVGAAEGYIEAKRRQNSDVHALAGSVNQDIAASNADAARALHAFQQIRVCREQAAAQIKQSLHNGEIDTATAEARLTDQKTAMEKDIAAVEQFTKSFDDATEGYRAAARYVAQDTPENQAYLQRYAMPPPPPAPPLLVATAAGNVRSAPNAKGPVVGKFAKGETIEPMVHTDTPASGTPDAPVPPPNPGWREVRLASGERGYVAKTLVNEKPAAKPKPIDIAKVSPDVRAMSQPLYEGVEKRGALAAEISTAKADTTGATFAI